MEYWSTGILRSSSLRYSITPVEKLVVGHSLKVVYPFQLHLPEVPMTAFEKFNVGGILLNQPFKIRRLGHFGFNLVNMEEGVRFYIDWLGFRISDVMDYSKRATCRAISARSALRPCSSGQSWHSSQVSSRSASWWCCSAVGSSTCSRRIAWRSVC